MAQRGNLKIGDFVLDPSRNLLTGKGGENALEPKVVDVLVVLATRPGIVISRDELIDAVWKAEFGADERLTRAISQLRKAFGDERDAPRYIETVSKRGYRLVAAVSAADVSEAVPPVPHRADRPTASTDAMSPPSGATPSPVFHLWQSWGLPAILGLLLVTAAVAAWRSFERQAPDYARDLVALRPFAAGDSSPEIDRLARQTYSAVKRLLAFNHLSVVEHGASGSPRGPAMVLEPEFDLTATVERAGERYAVTVFLADNATGQTVWSQRFDRADADTEGLQEEVGSNVAYVVGCGLNDRAAARTNPTAEAFKVYLQACYLNFPGINEEKGLALARRLNAIAPQDAYGHGLAAIANAGFGSRPDVTAAEAAHYIAEARKAAASARSLDPESPHATFAEALLASGVAHWLGVDAFTRRAGANLYSRALAVHFLTSVGRVDEAVRAAEQRLAMAPLSLRELVFAAIAKMRAGDHVAADRLLEKALQLRPRHSSAHFYRFVNAAFYGDAGAARAQLDSAAAAGDWDAAARLCWQTFIDERASGRRSDENAVMDACAAHAAGDPSKVQYLARMAVRLGYVDRAYQLLQGRSLAWRGATQSFFYPEMAPFRADPRFMAFIAPSGLPEYWSTSGNWPDFCRKEVLPYDCNAAAVAVVKRSSVPG